MTELIGQTIGPYHITGFIGEGGMAVVYRAYEEALDREVALKILPVQLTRDRVFVQRFMQEARASGKMMHPHIVTVYSVGEFDQGYYIAMAYIKGHSLAQILQTQHALPPARAAHLIGQMANALDYAHRQGVIHRDVKPGNILVAEGDHAWLTDFGIAKAMTEGGLTRTGTMVGTPAYMAPEQAKGQPVSGQTDQYALAVVTYETLTGHPPFDADTSHAILYQHVHQAPDLSWLPLPYHPVLQRALAKTPEERFTMVSEFGQALQFAASEQITPVSLQSPVSTTPPPRPVVSSDQRLPKRRLPVWLWAGGIAAIVVILLLVLSVLTDQRNPSLISTSTPIISDDFSINEGRWGWLENDIGVIEILDGFLSIYVEQPYYTKSSTYLSPLQLTDFTVQVKAAPIAGSRDNNYGFFFLNSNRDVIYFAISSEGYFCVQKSENGTWHTLQNWTKNSVIVNELGRINLLAVQAKDSKFTFYVNNQPMILLETAEPFIVTELALAAGTEGEQGGVRVVFDNLVVYEE
ncbi:MAG: serine/threonine protein kinase [Anaerolineae bacterium]|nr:serine/threonine protein kinase [Anaerolineae bacterium]